MDARAFDMSLPMPMVNMISGGLHAGGNLDFQDFLAIPVGAGSYHESLDWIVAIYRRLGAQRVGSQASDVGPDRQLPVLRIALR